MPIDAFARLIAQITESAEREALAGKAESQASTPLSTHPASGSSFVNVSGLEIGRHAEGATPSTDTLNRHTTSTTSDCGQSSPNSAPTMTTLCCSVVAAIGSFIPETTSQGNSFSVTVEAVRGFTNVPWGRKETSPDGPRYRALGNSMAVNCMSWIGQRIDQVEKLLEYQEAAE
jgi:site-specific DNA-cytosine methylase